MKNTVVIGYGGQGSWHAEHILNSDVVRLLGVYDINPSRNELAESRGIHAYESLNAVLADERAELAVIATPNDVHKEITIRCLNAGKNVICEKPVAMSVAALNEMIDAAKRNGKLFTVHQNRRWDVDYLAMKQIQESGEIGRILNIESRIHGSRGIPSDWRGEKKHGGGMLLDWGVHLIDQILQLFPERIVRVFCMTTHITNKEVDDGFKLLMTFETGATALVEVGTYNFLPLPRFYMQAEKGTALIRDWREEAQVARCKYWNEKEVLPVQTAAGITKTMAPRDSVTLDEYTIPRPQSDVHDFYRNVVKAIDGIEPQLVTHEQIRRVLRVIEAAFASAESGNAVAFEERG